MLLPPPPTALETLPLVYILLYLQTLSHHPSINPLRYDLSCVAGFYRFLAAATTGCWATANQKSLMIYIDGAEDTEVAALTEQFKDLKKKKKKDTSEENGDEAPADEGGFDPTALKKRKKKVPKEPAVDSFDAQLAEAGVLPREIGEEGDAEVPAEVRPEDAGDLLAGTGVWNATSTVDLTYPLLLTRFFTLLRSQHPDLAGDGRRNYKIPPPQVLREGIKKTIYANISDICKRMKRHDEHVTQFLFAELGTSGSVDGSKRLVIRGKFQQKQLENVLRRYICESQRLPPFRALVADPAI